MRNSIALACSTLALATIASAQTFVFAPDNAGLTQPSSSTLAWRDSTTGFRSQFIYDTSHFTSVGVNGPCVITRMRFRAANASTSVGGSYPGDGVTTGATVDIGTSASDYNAASTTYATNRGVMQNVLTFAILPVAAGAGLTPNNYVIDIVIPGGFVYDPTAGQDLLIEVAGPDFIGTIPTMSTGVSLAASRCQRVANTTTTGLTGTFSGGFCPVVLFDIVGPGGIPNNGSGNPLLVAAGNASYGTGCGLTSTRSFGELFPGGVGTSLDLGTGVTLFPNIPGAPTAYTAVAGSGAPFFPISGAALLSNALTPALMTDDAMSQACTLPFAFPFVGGSTTTIHANTNGYIALAATTATGGDFSPTLTDMVGATAGTHGGLPRIFPCWYDLYASRNTTVNATAGVYFNVDAVNNKVYVTWNDVGELATSTAGAKSFNIQVELSPDGTIDIRYGAMSVFGSTTQGKIVGFTPGLPSPAPASTDLSVAMPFSSGSFDSAPLALATGEPIIGSNMAVTTNFVPAPGLLFNIISTTQYNPGIDLGIVGAPGCLAHVDPGTSVYDTFLFGTGTVAFNVAIPNDISFLGVSLYMQSAAVDPFFNAFGFITSNGVTLTFGTVP